jgi:hypothetical protein
MQRVLVRATNALGECLLFRLLLFFAVFSATVFVSRAAPCSGCTAFGPPQTYATNTSESLNEASGLAVSVFNSGVLWSHNDDGSDGRLFAYTTNGTLLARFDIDLGSLKDIEEIALGRGPTLGVWYLYAADIGGGASSSGIRGSVRIIRVREPQVPLTWAQDPRNRDFNDVERFTLRYPDDSFDAETMFVDPLTGDVIIGTKEETVTRIFRANLNSARDGASVEMQLLATVPFPNASGGAISVDGSRIVLRNEETARMWIRCPGETIAATFSRPGVTIRVVGPPLEINGEGISFLPDGSGYVTISDSTVAPPVYVFPALCSITAPGTTIVEQPQSAQLFVGQTAQLTVTATGANLRYQWQVDGRDIPGATSSTLILTDVLPENAGSYTVAVIGDGGTVVSEPAAITVGSPTGEPVIRTQPQSIVAVIGGFVRLSVEAFGEPPLSYTWSKNGRVLPGNEPVRTFLPVRRSDAGRYQVVVSNPFGSVVSEEVELRVVTAPRVHVSPHVRRIRAGGRLVLRARAGGTGPFSYEWRWNNQLIPEATGPTLTIPAIGYESAGLYTVTVYNEGGQASDGATVIVR